MRGGRRIINTGSFTPPGRAHWVEWDRGWLTHGRVDESGEDFRKSEPLDCWRLGMVHEDGIEPPTNPV